jgi:hypothetical protein
MSDVAIAETRTLRRVALSDLSQIGSWLITRLQQRHTSATPAMILSWLRSCTMDNDVWFVRMGEAIGMAMVRRVALEPHPIVSEIFMLAPEGDEADAADLYPYLKTWAQSVGAARMELLVYSDATRVQVQYRIGRVDNRNTHSQTLGLSTA